MKTSRKKKSQQSDIKQAQAVLRSFVAKSRLLNIDQSVVSSIEVVLEQIDDLQQQLRNLKKQIDLENHLNSYLNSLLRKKQKFLIDRDKQSNALVTRSKLNMTFLRKNTSPILTSREQKTPTTERVNQYKRIEINEEDTKHIDRQMQKQTLLNLLSQVVQRGNMQVGLKMIQKNPNFRFINELRVDKLARMDKGEETFFKNSINYVVKLVQIQLQIITFMRKIMVEIQKINKSEPEPFKAVSRLKNFIRDLVNCEVCSIFIVDYNLQQLRTINSTELGVIFLPINQGLVGCSITNKKPLNILNAYHHPSFKKQFDLKSGFKTASVLCVPIESDNGSIFAVIQAINKVKKPKHFTDQDILYIKLVGKFANSIINNIFHQSQSLKSQYLKSVLEVTHSLMQLQTTQEILNHAQKQIKTHFCFSQFKIILVQGNSFFTNAGFNTFFKSIEGLAGLVFSTNQKICLRNPSYHVNYNNLFDIDTSLPLGVLPITTQTGNSIGVLQFVTYRGFINLSSKEQNLIMSQPFEEGMQLLCKTLLKLFENKSEFQEVEEFSIE